jgi:NACHT conflict system protein/NACHT domain-containing protein
MLLKMRRKITSGDASVAYLHKDSLHRALGVALRSLLELIQDELLDTELTEEQARAWTGDIKQFIRGECMQQVMRQVFTTSDSTVSEALLREGWENLPRPSPLPPEFDWSRVAKRFSRAVRSLRESDEDLRGILLAQAVTKTAQAVQQLVGVTPDFDLEKYRESLIESHQHLKLELLDPNGSSYKVQLRSVFVPQTVRDCQEYIPQVFEIPKEHLARLRKSGGLDKEMLGLAEEIIGERRRRYLDQSPRSVLEVIADNSYSHLVVLGNPGSGKSTLLKALALEWAQLPYVTERASRSIPLFIELNAYNKWQCSNGKSFVRYLHEAQVVCRLDQQLLDGLLKRKGGALLLLDGLDEVFDSNQRNDVLNDIHRFSNDYPGTPIIVTSRIIGYQQRRLGDAGFRHFILQDLDDAQIEEFLDRWHQTFVPEVRERTAKRRRLAEAISGSRSIREMADNPLLLTMMSILNLHQELPRDRVQLYEQASRVLLHQWEVERLGLKVTVDYKEKAEMLRRLALRMQDTPGGLKGNIIHGDELEKLFRHYFKKELEHPDPRTAAREMMQQLRERNYILCLLGQDNFAFVHRTLLEYFCASALARQSLTAKSSVEFLKHDVFGLHWRDESWHEVLRLIAGMDDQVPVERVADIIDFLLAEKDEKYKCDNIFLAANCCLEVRNPKALGESRKRVSASLVKLLRFDFPYYYENGKPKNNGGVRFMQKQ